MRAPHRSRLPEDFFQPDRFVPVLVCLYPEDQHFCQKDEICHEHQLPCSMLESQWPCFLVTQQLMTYESLQLVLEINVRVMTCLWMSQQCLEVTTRNVTNWIVYGDSVGSRQVTGKIGTMTN